MTIKRWLGVVAALGLFLGLIIVPAYRAAREAELRRVCPNHLKQIGLAMFHYHERYGCFPAAATFDDKGNASFYVYGHEDGAGLSLA